MPENSNNFCVLDNDYSEIIASRDWVNNPEYRLIWGIIERAVRDVLGNQSAEVAAAYEWLWGQADDSPEEFSFAWCCEILNLELRQLQGEILRTRAKLNKLPASNFTTMVA